MPPQSKKPHILIADAFSTTGARKTLVRRAAILCVSFTRNFAFYKAGWEDFGLTLLQPTHPQAAFWRQTNANFIDLCALEWCKLLGDKEVIEGKKANYGKHSWRVVVTDAPAFESKMYSDLGTNKAAFDRKIEEIRAYRDKFVAHLDMAESARIPIFDGLAQSAVSFYLDYIASNEALPGVLGRLPNSAAILAEGFVQAQNEAKEVFRQAASTREIVIRQGRSTKLFQP